MEEKFDKFFEKDISFDSTELFAKTDFDSFNNNNNNNNLDKVKTNGNNDKFDPFGLSVTETKVSNNNNTKNTSNNFDFEADFANFDTFNNNSSKNESNGFDAAWGETKTSKKKIKDSKVNKITKFSSDYSDNFEQDIEQVLKRSMLDQ